MLDLTQGVFGALINDAALTALLGTFGEDSAGEAVPAVFTSNFVPEDAPRPYIWTYGNAVDEADDTKTETGRDIVRDFLCVTDNDGAASLVEQIAERVRAIFHRASIDVPDGTVVIASASGPTPAETDQTLQGRIVSVRFRLET